MTHYYRHPAPPVLGELLGQVFELNQRLQPHLERYQQIMNDDPNWSDDVSVQRNLHEKSSDYNYFVFVVAFRFITLLDIVNVCCL